MSRNSSRGAKLSLSPIGGFGFAASGSGRMAEEDPLSFSTWSVRTSDAIVSAGARSRDVFRNTSSLEGGIVSRRSGRAAWNCLAPGSPALGSCGDANPPYLPIFSNA